MLPRLYCTAKSMHLKGLCCSEYVANNKHFLMKPSLSSSSGEILWGGGVEWRCSFPKDLQSAENVHTVIKKFLVLHVSSRRGYKTLRGDVMLR